MSQKLPSLGITTRRPATQSVLLLLAYRPPSVPIWQSSTSAKLIKTATQLMAISIQWNVKELQSLYCFARYMGSDDVCDMILDRWYAELHDEVGRQTHNESDEQGMFDILDISPDFLNHLAQHDSKALDFFLDVIIARRGAGWERLNTYSLPKWDDGVKEILIKKLKTRKVPVITGEDRDGFWKVYHHHHTHKADFYRVQTMNSPATTTSKLAENLTSRMVKAAALAQKEVDKVYHFWWEKAQFQGTERKTAGGNLEEERTARLEALEKQEEGMKSTTLDFVMGVFASIPSHYNVPTDDDQVHSHAIESTRPPREPTPDRIQFGNKWGMTLDGYAKDTKAISDRKCQIIEARVQTYINFGIDLGDVPGRERVQRTLAANGVSQADLDKDMFDLDDDEQVRMEK
jgi:hypothetical protein